MLAVFFSLLQVAAVVRALSRSTGERFVPGIVGGLARSVLMVLGLLAIVWATFPKAGAPAPAILGLMALSAAVLGPLVSFAVLWSAHVRKRDVPFAQEERLSRPFGAWLPVALFDMIFVAMSVLAWARVMVD